jgi:hypothetical protein
MTFGSKLKTILARKLLERGNMANKSNGKKHE